MNRPGIHAGKHMIENYFPGINAGKPEQLENR